MTADIKKQQSVMAVVLAFSREEDLKKVIHNLKNQTRKPDEIMVVFQGSSPTILAWLKEQTGITLQHQGNIGTAGGFTSAMKKAIEKGHQWTWLFDDDAVPELTALEEMTKSPYFDDQKTGFLASVVVNPKHEVYMSPIAVDSNRWYGTVLKDGCVPVMAATWIGCLVSSQSLLDFGLPIEDFFMYDEDYEYTSRVARQRSSYCVINSVTVHHQKGIANPFTSKVDMLKHGYMVRNHFATIRLSNKSFLKKLVSVWLWFFKNLAEIVTHKVPFKTTSRLLEGLILFRPKIKYLKSK